MAMTASDVPRTRRTGVVLAVGFAVLCYATSLAPARAAAADACSDVPRPFLAVIPAAHAAAADALLGSETVVELTDAQASMLLDVARGPWTLADTVLSRAIAELERRRESRMDRRQGTWTPEDAEEMATLVRLEPEVELDRLAPRPFLVAAVRGVEGTGSYSARHCGDTLSVFHGSLGTRRPPPTRAPLVVFLRRKPTRVEATYSVIQ